MMRGLQRYLLFDLRSFWREPMAWIFTFILPAAFFIAAAKNGGLNGVAYTRTYSPSYVGLIILIVTLFTIGPNLVLGRELGFYKRLLATPVDTTVILVSSMIRAFVVVALGIVEVLVLSYFVMGALPVLNIPQFFIALLLGSGAIFAGGVLLGSIFKSTKTAFSVSVILLQPLMFFSGATIPLAKLPGELQTASLLFPTKHMVDVLRLGWQGELFSQPAIMPAIFLTTFLVVSGALARVLFRWTSR